MNLHSDRKKRGLAMLLCMALLFGTVAGLPARKTEAVSGEAETENVASGSAFCTIKSTGEQAEVLESVVEYNGKEISMKSTPLVKYQGRVLVAFSPVLHKKGPKVSYEYTGKTKRVRLVRENKVVTFHMDNKTYYASGQKKSFSVAPLGGVYSTGKGYKLVPLQEICSALGISCTYHSDSDTYILTGKAVKFSGKKVTTKYAYSMKKYAKLQYKRAKKVSLAKYQKLVDPSKDTTKNFKFLRVDRYRSVDKKKFRAYYQYLIEDYCQEVGISTKKSCLYGKADVFLKAAKKYKLDPLYLVNQTFLESAYGTSKLASGNVIKKIALKNFPRKKNGKFKTKKLKSKKKVYNLYGIKAYDADPFVGATSYAYYKKWTTVNRAIYGAASYLRSNYVHGKYKQNTIFEMRFAYRASLWHQYATSPEYAENIGQRMYLMSSCYSKSAKFVFDFPKYK